MKKALITGASAGIGKEFCEQLAARRCDLVVVARRRERLQELARDLNDRHGVDVEVLTADLSDPEELARVARRLRQGDVDVLINNAGFGLKTGFLDTPIEREVVALDVMVKAPLVLSHAAANTMKSHGGGLIINVSSVAGFIASGTYSAAKSYLTVFSEALAAQLDGTRVRVMALCPGFTHTEFHEAADIRIDKTSAFTKPLWLDVQDLVADALKDAEAGKMISVPGRQYKAITTLLRIAPRPLVRHPRLMNRHRPGAQ